MKDVNTFVSLDAETIILWDDSPTPSFEYQNNSPKNVSFSFKKK